MKKGSGKDKLVVIDSYTMEELARFSTVKDAAEKLGVNANSVYVGIHTKKPVYECYWVYAKNMKNWKPAPLCHRKTKGTKVPPELQKLIDDVNKL